MIQPTCFGSNNGEIRIGNIIGGTPPYQFSIDGGISYGNDSIFTGLVSFVYNILIRDANNCIYSYVYNLGQPSNLNFNVSQNRPATCDSANGRAIVTNVVGGIAPYQYRIDVENRPFQSIPIFENLPPGNHLVTVQDATGVCEVTKLVAIAGNPGITYDYEITDATCFRGQNGSIRIFNIQGGTVPYRAQIDTNSNFVVVDQTSSVTFNGLQAGFYNLRIRDQEGCVYRLNALDVREPDSIRFSIRNVKPSRKDSTEGALFVHDVGGGTAPYRYSLTGIGYLPMEYSFDTDSYSALVKRLAPGGYTVFVQDTNGCITSASATVYTYQFATRFEIPNVFTPNGDGFNDTFFINRLPSNSKLKVYARNGRLVYSSENYENDWDGGDYPSGTYFYAMEIPNIGDFVGWLEIWR
jgi:gliding motility-associated-like protein